MALKDDYVTVSQAASLIGVTRQTISRWVKQSKISGEKIGREVLISRNELDKYRSNIRDRFVQNVTDAVIDVIRQRFKYSEKDKIEPIYSSSCYEEEHRENVLNFSVKRKDGSYSEVQTRFRISQEKPIIEIKIDEI